MILLANVYFRSHALSILDNLHQIDAGRSRDTGSSDNWVAIQANSSHRYDTDRDWTGRMNGYRTSLAIDLMIVDDLLDTYRTGDSYHTDWLEKWRYSYINQ